MIDDKATIEISDPTKLPKSPLVSVYMLAYKHERFIRDAIEGVIAQQCNFEIELIIGEDCSPDNTRNIATDYQRKHPQLIRILTSNKNVGVRENAVRCQDATRGTYIALCEGDDYWHHPKKLQMQVDLMLANPDMAFCHTDYDRKTKFRTRHNRHKNCPSPWLAKGDAYLSLLHERSVMTATTMFPREIVMAFRNTEFSNPRWPFGDFNRLLYASLIGTAGYIDVSTATYRKTRGSSTNKSNHAHLRMILATQECIEMFLMKHPVAADSERQIRSEIMNSIYRAAFYAERTDLMDSAYQWLKDNGFGINNLEHQIKSTAVKLKFPVRSLSAIKNLIDANLSAIPA